MTIGSGGDVEGAAAAAAATTAVVVATTAVVVVVVPDDSQGLPRQSPGRQKLRGCRAEGGGVVLGVDPRSAVCSWMWVTLSIDHITTSKCSD